MAKQSSPVTDQDIRIGRRVNRQVSVLLNEIEKEDVPDRLLEPHDRLGPGACILGAGFVFFNPGGFVGGGDREDEEEG